MAKRKVINKKNIPAGLPIAKIVLTWLALDYWNAPQWLWGALGLFWLVIVIAAVIAKLEEEELPEME